MCSKIAICWNKYQTWTYLRNIFFDEEPKTNLEILNFPISSLIAAATSSDSSKTASASTCPPDIE